MKITLKLVKICDIYRLYEMPSVVEFEGVVYKMTQSSNLIRALKCRGMSLIDVFEFDVPTSADRIDIHRRRIRVKMTTAEIKELKENRKRQLRTRQCVICGVDTIMSRSMMGTCSDQCKSVSLKNRGAKIQETHWTKTTRSSDITARRIATRLQNDRVLDRVYTPWNKGKTNVYSDETRHKISDAALKQFESRKFRKTKIELMYENVLVTLGVRYTYSYIFQRRQFDFFLPDVMTVVELQGDFWHGNPTKYTENLLRDHQKMKRLDDRVKKSLVERNGLRYVEFWESEMYNSIEEVIKKTKELFE